MGKKQVPKWQLGKWNHKLKRQFFEPRPFELRKWIDKPVERSVSLDTSWDMDTRWPEEPRGFL